MADISKRASGCDDSCRCCERGKRGKRGHDGATGPAGPEGPAGPTVFTDIVFRPYSPIPSHDNVFTTWDEVMAALAATANDGMRTLYFDFVGSPTIGPIPPADYYNGFYSPEFALPPGDYDMKNVVWSNIPGNGAVVPANGYAFGGTVVAMGDGVTIRNLAHIDGRGLIIKNTSALTSPIRLNPANANLYIDGLVHFATDYFSVTSPPEQYPPTLVVSNPNVKPVILLEEPTVSYKFYGGKDGQSLLGIYSFGVANGIGDSILPMSPIVDMNGCFAFFRMNFQQGAITSLVPGAFALVERNASEATGIGNSQNWVMPNGNITIQLITGDRIAYWLDNNNNSELAAFIPLGASRYTVTPRSANYQPNPPADATQYNLQPNQFANCNPTPAGVDGLTGLTLLLPTAFGGVGELVTVKDIIGTATPAVVANVSAPVTIIARPGETILGEVIGGAASAVLDAAFQNKVFVSNGVGAWMVLT